MYISNKIQPWDFTLLSPEKQESFEPSENFRKSLELGQSEVCNYIRTILWENKKFNLNTLAHESGVAIRIVILLSNYTQSYRELEQALEKNKDFLKWIYQEWDIELVIDIIQNDFESFSLQNTWEIRQKFIDRKKGLEQQQIQDAIIRRENESREWQNQIHMNREKILSKLSQYFGLISVDTLKWYWVGNDFIERVSDIDYRATNNDFIEFLRERKIRVVIEILWVNQDSLLNDFWNWIYAKYNIDDE